MVACPSSEFFNGLLGTPDRVRSFHTSHLATPRGFSTGCYDSDKNIS